MNLLKHIELKHFPLFFLIVYTCPMIFLGFSDSVLQIDEGMDTFISTTILKFGFPVHSDGINSSMLFADVYDGLFVYRPWVSFYAQAFSLSVIGQTTFAARLPFALIGVFSVIFFYRFSLKFTGRPFIAFLAAFLLASSIPALIYFRTARYVGIPILLTVLLLNFYIDIYKDKKWSPFPLTVVSIIFFHTMYVEFAGMIAGVLIHFFFHIKETTPENRKSAAWAAGVTGVFCIPWLIFISPMFSHVSQHLASTSTLIDPTWQGFPKRFFGFLFQLNNYIFPFILLPLLFLKRLRPFAKQTSLLVTCSLTMLLTALPHSMPLQQYIISSFPLLFLLLAILLASIVPKYPLLQSLLATLLITTNLVHVGPLFPLKALVKDRPEWFQQSPYLQNVYASLIREVKIKSVYFDYLYEISHVYRGPLDAVVEFFKTHGKPGDSCYIDSEFESLAFYTGMKMISNQDLSQQHPPDWIVLRGKDRIFEEPENLSPEARNVKEVLQSNAYTRIELDAPAIWVNNTYDIQIHEFRSPSSSDKVTVYQRTDYPSNR
ncbi:MAG: glycosyltransferase family 39 protein [Nitrospinaceae bacterium]|nr:glycosyltransferase family 39 protein [Nitrospinaceae bacterium]